MIEKYIRKNNLDWNNVHGIFTVGAAAMERKYRTANLDRYQSPKFGVDSLLRTKRGFGIKITLCKSARGSQQHCPNSELDKNETNEGSFLPKNCYELGAEHGAMLFHNETRWLSRGWNESLDSEKR